MRVTIEERVIKTTSMTAYKDQFDSLDEIRSSMRPVPSRAKLIRKAIDEFIERHSQPDLIATKTKSIATKEQE